jgi:predicted HD superfamily hydrolase involved in NAD metabolism
MNFDEIGVLLLKTIGPKRYQHSMRVMDTAVELSNKHGLNLENVKTASILHDCGRIKKNSCISADFSFYSVIPDAMTYNNPNLHHAVIGRYVAYECYGIRDSDILNAIRYHTTGRPGMSLLEKIIYLSDAIEPDRDYEGVDEIRSMVCKNIDKALVMSLKSTVDFLNAKKISIHGDTKKCYNYYNNNNLEVMIE